MEKLMLAVSICMICAAGTVTEAAEKENDDRVKEGCEEDRASLAVEAKRSAGTAEHDHLENHDDEGCHVEREGLEDSEYRGGYEYAEGQPTRLTEAREVEGLGDVPGRQRGREYDECADIPLCKYLEVHGPARFFDCKKGKQNRAPWKAESAIDD